MERLTPSSFPILSYNLEGGDPATMYDLARYQLRPLLSRVPGVGRVDVTGSDVREIEVIADPARLAAQRMTFDDLAAAIRAATTVDAVGRMPANYKQYLIVTTNEAHSADDIANVVVAHGLRVRDLATVAPGLEDRVSIFAGDGKPAALINVTRQIGGNTLKIADSVAHIAQSVVLPKGMILRPVYDQASLVRDAVRSVRDAMLVGALLAVVVLLLFLRHARITAISASAIPLTMSITVGVMALLGQTFNLMTLGAMAIAIGLVIDDAVVITENIVRHLHFYPDRTAAIREAVQELIIPVTTSTLTTVVVFLPLGLLTGVEGQFFKALSITLTIAVMVSLLIALTVIPLLAESFLRPIDVDEESERADAPIGGEAGAVAAAAAGAPAVARRPRGVLAGIGRGIDSLADSYQRALGRSLAHARWMVLGAVQLLGAGMVAHQYVESRSSCPEIDEGAFVLDYWTPGRYRARGDRSDDAYRREDAGGNARSDRDLPSHGCRAGAFCHAPEPRGLGCAAQARIAAQRSRSNFEVIDEGPPTTRRQRSRVCGSNSCRLFQTSSKMPQSRPSPSRSSCSVRTSMPSRHTLRSSRRASPRWTGSRTCTMA